MYYNQLADKVRYYKENEKGVSTMCEIVEKLCEEAAKKATKDAEWRTKVESVLRGINAGLSYEQISKCIDIPIEQVMEIATEKTA